METKQTYQYDIFINETYRITMDRMLSAEEEDDIKQSISYPNGAAWELKDINVVVKEVS